ncbi:MAG TPA: type II toxin-antitoxin system HicB family antitoxin [Candidatus Caccovicinus merdipullorum]|uniref:Type II toxin-antitoxin system HicB family antitoxin n=1 Tax=Candidatus Caccovicinus merdipullorum TaxID=2840724 RepID=A0A9D1GK63_9FIRM|nr:type II toxin-antitoxin system HicB family antitoxin [Candidatus Caccovicinus merdipullorum]
MLSAYPACFFKEDSGYSVVFPDLNYLSTCGETLDEALTAAVDCLAGYLYWLKNDGDSAPEASAPTAVNPAAIAQELEIEPAEAFVNLITVDVAEYARKHFEKSVRKNITIPAWLNEAALQQNINFSQVLQEALKQKLNISDRRRA